MHVARSETVHDVVIVGSGAAGGMAAWNLARRGVRVLVLDAGTKFPVQSCRPAVPWAWRDRVREGLPPVPLYRVDAAEQPYATAPGHPYALVRVWGRGGKTNVWGRISLRYSDLDFTAPDHDGWEIAWPIRYKDLSRYYDRLDQMLGICGGNDDHDSLPGSRYHVRPPNPLCGEALLRSAGRRIGLSIVSSRRAMIRRPKSQGRYFNSSDYLLEPAIATGRATVIDNAVVGRLLVDDRGRACAVQYFDRHTREERRVRARVIIVAASCIDSTRILLNSQSARYPNGIGNSNDIIGRYLTEQVRFHLTAILPSLIGSPVLNRCVGSDDGIYLPRFNHRDGSRRDYLRGYGMQFWGCGPGDDAAFAKQLDGFGVSFKDAVRARYPAVVRVHPYGEVLPRPDNRVTVDRDRVDRYGLPIARIAFSISDNERRMIAEMYDVAESLLAAAKAEILPFERGAVDLPGSVIHEHGTCRMGADPRRSAVNAFCQSHEVPNLFIIDGAVFPTATEKNPTLTILALAWRATDYLANELRLGNV